MCCLLTGDEIKLSSIGRFAAKLGHCASSRCQIIGYNKSIARCWLFFPLTARTLVLCKNWALNGSSLLAPETRATSGTSAHVSCSCTRSQQNCLFVEHNLTRGKEKKKKIERRISWCFSKKGLNPPGCLQLEKMEAPMSDPDTRKPFYSNAPFMCIIVKVTSVSWLSVLWLGQWLTWP